MRSPAPSCAFKCVSGFINRTLIALTVLGLALSSVTLRSQERAQEICPRPQAGSVVTERADLRSKDGVLDVSLIAENAKESDGRIRYCFTDRGGQESPNLRVTPGDLVIIHLKNAMTDVGPSRADISQAQSTFHMHMKVESSCSSGVIDAVSTNLHFHGLTIPPTCHQDDVLKTSVQPGDSPFEYRFRIPEDEPPGLYWYHPHIHGFSKEQVLGGASGALIVEGIERAKPELAGLPERVFIIRDEDLTNPNAPPSEIGANSSQVPGGSRRGRSEQRYRFWQAGEGSLHQLRSRSRP